MEYDRKNTFIFSRNERKEKDTHPDLTGNFTDENGDEFFMDIWAKEKDGRKFFTGKMKKKEARGNKSFTATASRDLNDDMPF